MTTLKMKVCQDHSLIHGEKWTLVPEEARQHKERYPRHRIVDLEDFEKKQRKEKK